MVPWRRFSRNELENELKTVLHLMVKLLGLFRVRVSIQNDVKDRAFEMYILSNRNHEILNVSQLF